MVKTVMIKAAWLSLMIEAVRKHGNRQEFIYGFFRRHEIINRAIYLFDTEFDLYDQAFYSVTYKDGKDKKKIWIFCSYLPSTGPYYAMTYFREVEDKHIRKTIDALLNHSKWALREKYSESIIRSLLGGYFHTMENREIKQQNNRQNMIVREAIWIAGAALTYNEYMRTKSTNIQDYYFAQAEISKLASYLISGAASGSQSVYTTMIGQYYTKDYRNSIGEYFIQNPLGDPEQRRGDASYRRISLRGEGVNLHPEFEYNFEVQTFTSPVSIRALMDFIYHEFSDKVLNQNSQTEEELYEEKYAHAKTLSLEDLKYYAEHNEAEQPVRFAEEVNRFRRNAYVVHYARRRAKGICQLCGHDAPFIKNDGEPFLEVHHVKMLCEGGTDSIHNVVALCPNCHRRMHHLKDEEDVRRLREIAEKN